jgi:hypothetical protein
MCWWSPVNLKPRTDTHQVSDVALSVLRISLHVIQGQPEIFYRCFEFSANLILI